MTCLSVLSIQVQVDSLKLKALRFKKNIQFQIPDLRFIEGQTNCFKKRSEKLFPFSKTFGKIYKLFFQAAIPIPDDDIPSRLNSFPGGHQRIWDGYLSDFLVFSEWKFYLVIYGITTFKKASRVGMEIAIPCNCHAVYPDEKPKIIAIHVY